jgi:hypothetical protein
MPLGDGRLAVPPCQARVAVPCQAVLASRARLVPPARAGPAVAPSAPVGKS